MDEQAQQMQIQLEQLRQQVQFLEFAKKSQNSSIILEVQQLKYSNGDVYEGEVLNDRLRHGDGVHKCLNGDLYEGKWEYDQRQGKGKFTQNTTGVVYDGDWKADKAHGFGICEYGDGAVYEGEWENDVRRGWGKLVFKNGEEYEGEWCHDKMQGFGRWLYSDGAVFEGEYENGQRTQGKIVSADSQIEYEGSFKDGVREGKGQLYCKGLWKYEGEFKSDKIEGRGRCEWVDSSGYDGCWRNNQRHGWGSYFSKPFNYEGMWRNDKRHGKGKCQYDNSDNYEGEFKQDERCGWGKQQFFNGDYYEGDWLDDKRTGNGKCHYSNGHFYQGEWRKNQRHGFGKCIYCDSTIFEGQWEDDLWIQSPACPKNSTLKFNSTQCVAGQEQKFQICARDDKGNGRLSGGDTWKIQIIEENIQENVQTEITDFGNGVYEVKFSPQIAGLYSLFVSCDGGEEEEEEDSKVLSCCPIQFTVCPSGVSPKHCQIISEKISIGLQNCQFKIILRDKFGNTTIPNNAENMVFEILCTHQNGQEISVVTEKVYREEINYSFRPELLGYYRIQVIASNVQIQGSPFSIQITDEQNYNDKARKEDADQQVVVDQSNCWLQIAQSAYGMDGDIKGWDSSEEDNDETEEDRFANNHPDVPIIHNLQDLWKLGKFQQFKQRKQQITK